MALSGDRCDLAMEQLIQNGRLTITTQSAFRICFALDQCDTNPVNKTIHSWVSSFWETSSALKWEPEGWRQTVTGPENVAALKRSVQQSPCQSARKYVIALRLLDQSVKKILHQNLKMHLYENCAGSRRVEEFEKWQHCVKRCFEMFTGLWFFSVKVHFHLPGRAQ